MLCLGMGVVALATPVQASITIGVSPSIVELSGKPGSTGTVDLNVLNQGDEPFDASVAVEPYERVDASLSVPDWLSTNTQSVHVEPGQSAPINVSISIPKGQDAGGHYAAVSVTTGSSDDQGNVTAIAGKLVVPFLVTVEGKLKRKAEIERFAPVLELDGRLGFRLQVANNGNIHWESAGKTFVKSANGPDYGNLDLERDKVYPSRTRTLSTSSTLPIEPNANYSATVELDFGAKKPTKADAEFTFTPQLSVTGAACENLDRGPTVSTNLVNAGDLGVIAVTNMQVTRADGQPIGQTGVLGPDIAWPNDTATVHADLGDRLASGDYVLTIQVQTGASVDPIVQDVPFSIGGTGPNVAPICEQSTATPGS